MPEKNKLYFADCLEILKKIHRENPQGIFDLIYIDPPFNSKRNYNVLFESIDQTDTTAQKETFRDTWSSVSYKDTLDDIQDLSLDLYDYLAAIGVFVCFAEHVTGGMEKEARECGYYNEEIFHKRHPEIQILTVDQILKGELVNMPPVLETTFKSAAKARPQHDGKQKSFLNRCLND